MGNRATADPDLLPLRERKKLRTRKALADAGQRLFLEKGFNETTLDEVVDKAEVSKRTFFRMFSSKESLALAAELELWDAYLEVVEGRELDGPVLPFLRDALSATLNGLGEEWAERFIATRGIITHHPDRSLYDRSDLLSVRTQERLVGVLEAKLDIDSRKDVRLRLLGELSLGAWRCGAKNWVRSGRSTSGRRDIRGLVRRVEEAFDAIPESVALSTS